MSKCLETEITKKTVTKQEIRTLIKQADWRDYNMLLIINTTVRYQGYVVCVNIIISKYIKIKPAAILCWFDQCLFTYQQLRKVLSQTATPHYLLKVNVKRCSLHFLLSYSDIFYRIKHNIQ